MTPLANGRDQKEKAFYGMLICYCVCALVRNSLCSLRPGYPPIRIVDLERTKFREVQKNRFEKMYTPMLQKNFATEKAALQELASSE